MTGCGVGGDTSFGVDPQRRMEVVLDRIPEQQVGALLAKLQAPPLNEIADMPTLVQVVQGLEGIVNNGSHPNAA